MTSFRPFRGLLFPWIGTQFSFISWLLLSSSSFSLTFPAHSPLCRKQAYWGIISCWSIYMNFWIFFLQHTLSSYLFPLDNHSLKVLLWFYNFLVIFIRIAQFQCPRISLAYWKSFHLKISSEFASNSHFKSAGERCGLALRYLLSISLLSTSCSNVWSREDGWRSRVNLI